MNIFIGERLIFLGFSGELRLKCTVFEIRNDEFIYVKWDDPCHNREIPEGGWLAMRFERISPLLQLAEAAREIEA